MKCPETSASKVCQEGRLFLAVSVLIALSAGVQPAGARLFAAIEDLSAAARSSLVAHYDGRLGVSTSNGVVVSWTPIDGIGSALPAMTVLQAGSGSDLVRYDGVMSLSFSSTNGSTSRYLRGELVAPAGNSYTVFWKGRHRTPAPYETSGNYVYNIGNELNHQREVVGTEPGLELFDGIRTFRGGSLRPYDNLTTVWTTIYDRNSHWAYANGAQLTMPGTPAYNVGADPEILIGAFSSGGFNFNGELSDLIIFNSVLTDADRKLIEDYLGVLRPPAVLQTGEIRFDLPITATNTVLEVSPLLNSSNIWKMLVPVPVNNRLVVVDRVVGDTRFYRQVNFSSKPANMELIPAGPFEMGDALGDDYEFNPSPEQPVHSVNLSTFYMDKFEVRKSLWDEVYVWATTNGFQMFTDAYAKAPNHPVSHVSWGTVIAWCNARSLREGLEPCYYYDVGHTAICTNRTSEPYVKWSARGYRLPTEAEWEKAARGGLEGRRFPWNVNTISLTNANYHSGAAHPSVTYDLDTYGYHPDFNDGNWPLTAPVGSFPPNGYGLYDMAGNLAEFCWDWWEPTWYSNTVASGDNTHGPIPITGERVVRGGGWRGDASRLRCAMRSRISLGSASDTLGFRCVRVP